MWFDRVALPNVPGLEHKLVAITSVATGSMFSFLMSELSTTASVPPEQHLFKDSKKSDKRVVSHRISSSSGLAMGAAKRARNRA